VSFTGDLRLQKRDLQRAKQRSMMSTMTAALEVVPGRVEL
jgi:hypothetical protein